MLSVYLYQSFPSGMSSDISLSVRTCMNILHKNSTFFSLSLYCLIFVFSTNTCQNKNCTGQSYTAKESFQGYCSKGELNSSLLRQRQDDFTKMVLSEPAEKLLLFSH